MSTAVEPIPPGEAGITPYICVRGAADAIDYYKRAFNAVEVMRMTDPKGRVGHAELRLFSGRLMLSDEYPEMDAISPETLGGTPFMLHVYVLDVDEAFARAVEAGGVAVRAPADQFYGDRGGQVRDPFGHNWWLASRKENLTSEELEARAKKMFGGG